MLIFKEKIEPIIEIFHYTGSSNERFFVWIKARSRPDELMAELTLRWKDFGGQMKKLRMENETDYNNVKEL